MESLRIHLQRAGLEARGARDYVLGEVRRLTGESVSEAPLDVIALMDLLGKARPAGPSQSYVVIDLPVEPDNEHLPAVSRSLRLLLQMAVPLASRGMHLKVFLPERLRSEVVGSWFEEPISLVWKDEELRDMLQRRLKVARSDLESLEQICDSEARKLDPDSGLVRAANGSPGRLVRLGNEMLARVKGERLTPGDLP
jgi:hypothetical protein